MNNLRAIPNKGKWSLYTVPPLASFTTFRSAWKKSKFELTLWITLFLKWEQSKCNTKNWLNAYWYITKIIKVILKYKLLLSETIIKIIYNLQKIFKYFISISNKSASLFYLPIQLIIFLENNVKVNALNMKMIWLLIS